MSRLSDRQAQFAAALLGGVATAPDGWVGPHGQSDTKRFGVYRNNVMTSVIDALREGYPAVHRLLGDEYFVALAKLFVTRHPPRSPVMLDYGAQFPAFLETFEPLAGLPYLPEVARLERAWHEAYHSAEVSAQQSASLIATLAAVPAERATDICVELHPSTRVLHASWPVLTIWRMNMGECPMAQLDLRSAPQRILVLRPQAQVNVRELAGGEAAFIQALQSGRPLGAAAQQAVQQDAEFQLAAHLAAALSEGLLIRAWLPHERAIHLGS